MPRSGDGCSDGAKAPGGWLAEATSGNRSVGQPAFLPGAVATERNPRSEAAPATPERWGNVECDNVAQKLLFALLPSFG